MAATAMAALRVPRYRPLPLCLSVAAHLAALLLLSQHIGSQGAYAQTQAPIQAQAPRVLQVSLAQASSSRAAPAPAAPPASSTPATASPDRLQPRQTLSLPPSQKPLRRSADGPAAPAPPPVASESISDTPQPPRPAETASGTLPEPRYYLLRELSVRPAVLDDATTRLAFEGVPAQTVILRLFINEEGGIDRVAAEQSVLPEMHAQRLIEAFAQARFLPGQIDGAPVKSQMRIEVRLESALQRDVSLQ